MLNILDCTPKITEALSHFTPHLIYLFGSQVTGQTHAESDLDLAILGAEPYDPYELFMVAQQLADKCGCEVEIVDLSTASIVMRAEVVSKGRLLYCQHVDSQHEFEMYTLSMYVQANLDRREVLRNFLLVPKLSFGTQLGIQTQFRYQPMPLMPDNVHLNKIAIIERCLERIDTEYQGNPVRLDNFTIQDSVILNLQRACQATIDLAMHVVATKKLGLPQEARQAFDSLQQANLLDERLAQNLKAMVGFRNIAVHDYQAVNPIILTKILDTHLTDFTDFMAIIRDLS